MKRGILIVVVIVGLGACSFVANMLYDQKMELAPYEANAPTLFYAGLDKFLSNVSWMTLVQWEADQKMDEQLLRAPVDGAMVDLPVYERARDIVGERSEADAQ